MKRTIFAAVAALALVAGTSLSYATNITGSYETGDGSDGNQASPLGSTGPWTLTATYDASSGSATFSYVDRNVDQNITFSELTNLNAVFNSTTSYGGGSPRISVGLQDGASENYLHVYLGDSPNYIGTAANLNTYSGVNLIGNNDPGRYDDSNFAGGTSTTNYSGANALIGGLKVDEIDFVVDTFGAYGDSGNFNVTLDSINASFASTPLPASAWSGLVLLSGLGAISGIKRFRTRTA